MKQETKWIKFRALTQVIHLWLGLIGGIFIFVICLTGTIYTFSDEIKKGLNPEIFTLNADGQQKKSLDELVHPKQTNSIVVTDDATAPYQINNKDKENKENRRGVNLYINPYTGAELAKANEVTGSEFFGIMFKMHRWLLLDQKIGRPIVGVATILFGIGCLTGLIIWFPRKIKNYKQGLKIKTGNWKRFNHDLHNSLGFYSFIFLLVMTLTGLTWSFEWYKNGLNSLLGVNTKVKQKQITVEEQENKMSLDSIYAISKTYFTYEGNTRISLGRKPTDPITVTKIGTNFWAPSFSDQVFINPYNGEIIETRKFSDKTFGEKVSASFKALHIGDIYGTGTKIIYFISCLIATSLPITGTIIWWNSLRKKKKRKV